MPPGSWSYDPIEVRGVISLPFPINRRESRNIGGIFYNATESLESTLALEGDEGYKGFLDDSRYYIPAH